MSFNATYRRFTPEASDLLMRIAEALGAIRGARVLPAVADQLRASAKAPQGCTGGPRRTLVASRTLTSSPTMKESGATA